MSTAHPEVVRRTTEGSLDEILPLYFVQSQNEGSGKIYRKYPDPSVK